jgi:hypothetical protein
MAPLPDGPVRVPAGTSKATVRTEWRVLPSVPDSDGADLDNYVEDDADFASTGSPWSDTHPIANEALTEPSTGRLDLRIECLESYATDFWPAPPQTVLRSRRQLGYV